MLIDTHCHLNMMVKKEFDRPLTLAEFDQAQPIIRDAEKNEVTSIINVGTNLIESKNCIHLAQRYPAVHASIGLHPNDATPEWQSEIAALASLAHDKELNKIVAIGECGLDFHYPDYDAQQQKDVFKAQIELALNHNLALIVHTRQAPDETLRSLEEFKNDLKHCVIHCFSEDKQFADQVIAWGFLVGIGGTLTYPKNEALRTLFAEINLKYVVLETDAPFLPPQHIRGKQNSPAQIKTVAQFLAELRGKTYEEVGRVTTKNAMKLFGLEDPSIHSSR
jgi:TatD DNase family protein